MKYKAIIFDMDGTLLNTALDIYNCVNLFLEKFGYPLKSVKEVEMAMGLGAKHLIHESLPKGTSEADFEAFFAEYLPYYESHGKDLTKPYSGVLDLLKDLKNDGICLGVVSSKPQKGVSSLCDYYFKDLFDVAIGDTFGIKLKPEPDAILLALEKLRVSKNDALYVGDSEFDILAAKNAKMDGAACTWGYRDKATLLNLKPIYLVDSVDELRKIIYEK